jgi:hypothetical protein
MKGGKQTTYRSNYDKYNVRPGGMTKAKGVDQETDNTFGSRAWRSFRHGDRR